MLTVTAGLRRLRVATPLPYGSVPARRFAAGVAGGVLMVIGAPSILASIPTAMRGRVGGIGVFTGVGAGMALAGTVISHLHGQLGSSRSPGSRSASSRACLQSSDGPAGTIRPPVPDANRPADPGKLSGKLSWVLFWLMAAYVTNAIGFVPHTVFWVDYIARGLNQGLAAGNRYWVLLGISAAIGPLASGWLADRIGFSRSLRASLVAKAIGVAIPLFWYTPLALTASSIGVGSMAIGIVFLAAGRVAELVPADRQKQVWGWMTASFAIAHATTAFALSAIFARTGSYRILFVIGAIALLTGCAFDFISSAKHPIVDQD